MSEKKIQTLSLNIVVLILQSIFLPALEFCKIAGQGNKAVDCPTLQSTISHFLAIFFFIVPSL